MDDDGNKPDDEPPEPARDAAQEEGAELREVSAEELERILDAHKTSCETGGKDGEKADLSRTDLQGARLVSAKLQGAYLRGANLRGADLRGADLGGTNLQKANLAGANLQGAVLVDADLQGANLEYANLGGAQLRQANLQDTDLTHATFEWRIIAEGEGAGNLEAADLTGANLQNADLSDAKLSNVTGLLADKLAGANLSNANLPTDIAAFDGLDRVEEISRIARPIFIGILVCCVYSWLTIATTTDARLLSNSASSPLPIIGTEIPIAGFYWVAPILLLGVYVYLHLYLQRLWEGLADLPAVFPDGKPLNKEVYPWLLSGLVRAHFKRLKDERPLLSRLENWATIFLAWWIVPVTVLVFWGRYLPRHEWIGTGLHITLLVVSVGSAILLHRHAVRTLRRDVTAFRWRRSWSDLRTYQGAVAAGLGVVIALVSLGAIEGDARRDWPAGPVVLGGVATWVPTAFDRVGYRTFANLREADVSTKAANWWTAKDDERLDVIQGATLQGRDLRNADATRAFLVKADLRRANLQGTDLEEANLQGANFFGAKLQGANIFDADLQGAYLLGARLQGADLRVADLQAANLIGANLEGAHLASANLQGADLSTANLQGADLSLADLTKAKNLTREQLDETCGDDKTTLPDYLADYQMKPCREPAEQSPSN